MLLRISAVMGFVSGLGTSHVWCRIGRMSWRRLRCSTIVAGLVARGFRVSQCPLSGSCIHRLYRRHSVASVPALHLLVILVLTFPFKNIELALGRLKDLVGKPQLPAIFRDFHGDGLLDRTIKLGLDPVPVKWGRHPKAKSKQPFSLGQIYDLQRLNPRMKRMTGQCIAKSLPTPAP
jgi:hypothetical protein